MKDVQIQARVGDGETYILRGRGTLRQTPRDIVDRTVDQFRDFLGRNGFSPAVSVERYELVESSNHKEADGSPYVTIHVPSSTEEPYCRCNYGTGSRGIEDARAQGPVGYSEKQERSD